MKKRIFSCFVILAAVFSTLGSSFVCYADNDSYDENSYEYDYGFEFELEVQRNGITPIGISGKVNLVDGEVLSAQAHGVEIPTLTKVEAVVKSKAYTAKIGDDNAFNISFGSDSYDYNTTVQLTATTSDGQVLKKNVTIKNVKIYLSIDTVYYTDNVITGTTVPNATVSAFIGDSTKEYKKKADSKGKFSIKIPKQKIGTKIFVGAVSPERFNNGKTISVEQPKTTLSVDNMYDSGTKVKGYVTNVNKGDYLIIKSNGVSKKIKITKMQKKYKYSVTLSKYKTGQKVTVKLCTSKKGERVSVSTKVYLSNKIKSNMTKAQVLKTDYGKPDEKVTTTIEGNVGESWYYYNTHGYSVVWVFFYNGKVTQVTTTK